MTFKHCISFATDLAANFRCNRFRITPDIVSKLLRAAIWSGCAACADQFESEDTPFLGQVVDLDLLLSTGFDSEHAVLFLFHIFTQKPTTDRRIEQSDGSGFGRQQLLADSIEIFISHEKKKLVAARNLPRIKPCWLLNWVSIARVVACFPQASLSRPAATAADSETPCVCARPSDPRKQSRRAAPRAWPLILPSKPLIIFKFWNSLRRDCQMTGRGSNLDSNLNCAAWPTSCKGRFYLLLNHNINCVEFQFFLSPLLMHIPTFIPQDGSNILCWCSENIWGLSEIDHLYSDGGKFTCSST